MRYYIPHICNLVRCAVFVWWQVCIDQSAGNFQGGCLEINTPWMPKWKLWAFHAFVSLHPLNRWSDLFPREKWNVPQHCLQWSSSEFNYSFLYVFNYSYCACSDHGGIPGQKTNATPSHRLESLTQIRRKCKQVPSQDWNVCIMPLFLKLRKNVLVMIRHRCPGFVSPVWLLLIHDFNYSSPIEQQPEGNSAWDWPYKL